MTTRTRLVIALVWIVSLVAVAALVHAQNPITPLPSPFILSGSDVGFRVEGHMGNRPTGVLVVRVDGQWVVPRLSGGPQRLTER